MITTLFPFNLFTVKLIRDFSIWNSEILDRHTKYTPGYSYPILITFTFFSSLPSLLVRGLSLR